MTAADRTNTPTDHGRAIAEAKAAPREADRPRETPRARTAAADADTGHEPGYGHGV